MTDVLVTGTDTGVGKTVVAAALVLALRERGVRAVGFKPVETGVTLESGEDVGIEAADSEILARASGHDEPLARPLLRLAESLAPAVAAERAGVVLDPGQVESRIGALRAAGYTLIVEGAGGLLTPLAWGYSALDLAANGRFDVVVVARAGLGALNHSLLTLEAVRGRGVPVRGVVLNGRGDPPDLAEETNPEALRRLFEGGHGPAIVVAPRTGSSSLEAARALQPLLQALL